MDDRAEQRDRPSTYREEFCGLPTSSATLRLPSSLGILGQLPQELRSEIYQLIIASNPRCERRQCVWRTVDPKNLSFMLLSRQIYEEMSSELNNHAHLELSPLPMSSFTIRRLESSKIVKLTVTIHAEPICYRRCMPDSCLPHLEDAIEVWDSSGLICLADNLLWVGWVALRIRLKYLHIRFANDERSQRFHALLGGDEKRGISRAAWKDNYWHIEDSCCPTKLGWVLRDLADMLYGLSWFEKFEIDLPSSLRNNTKVQMERKCIVEGLTSLINYDHDRKQPHGFEFVIDEKAGKLQNGGAMAITLSSRDQPVKTVKTLLGFYQGDKPSYPSSVAGKHSADLAGLRQILRVYVIQHSKIYRIGCKHWVYPQYHKQELDHVSLKAEMRARSLENRDTLRLNPHEINAVSRKMWNPRDEFRELAQSDRYTFCSTDRNHKARAEVHYLRIYSIMSSDPRKQWGLDFDDSWEQWAFRTLD